MFYNYDSYTDHKPNLILKLTVAVCSASSESKLLGDQNRIKEITKLKKPLLHPPVFY
jgi:hypothetical protein